MSKFCTHCGAPLKEGIKFCTSCGAAMAPQPVPVVAPQPVPAVAPQPVPAVAPQPMPAAAPQSRQAAPQQSVPRQPAPQPAPKPQQPVPSKPVSKHPDNKGMRLGLTVFLAIAAFITLLAFMGGMIARAAFNKQIIVNSISSVKFEDVKVGSLANILGIDGISEDSTFEDAAVGYFAAIVSSEFGMDIQADVLQELMHDDDFREGMSNITDYITSGIVNNNFDGTVATNLISDLLKDNHDQIMDATGLDFSDDRIDSIAGKFSAVFDSVDPSDADSTDITDDDTDSDDTDSDDTDSDDADIDDADDDSKDIVPAINLNGLLGLSGIDTAVDVTGGLSDISDRINAAVPQVAVYILLAVAIIIFGFIVFLNRYKLPTGIRTVGIDCLLIGLLATALNGLVRLVPDLSSKMIEKFFAVNQINLPIADVLSQVARNYVLGVANKVLVPSIAFLAAGFAFIVASIIISMVGNRKTA